MSGLPQDLWALVLEIGVASGWEYRDLCSLALVCRKFRRPSAGASLWNALCAKDWPINETERTKNKSSSSTVVGVARRALEGDTGMQVATGESVASAGSSGFRRNSLRVWEGENHKIDWKSKYRELFGKCKAKRLLAHRRRLLIVQTAIQSAEREVKEVGKRVEDERMRLRSAVDSLKNLESCRLASDSLKVWQPIAVRARQQQMVDQMPVTATAQRSHLENEVKACREQMARLEASVEKKRQELGMQVCRLKKLTYNPTLPPLPLTPTREWKKKHKGNTSVVWQK